MHFRSIGIVSVFLCGIIFRSSTKALGRQDENSKYDISVNPEDLFRQTVQEWRSSNGRDYQPWIDLSTALLRYFSGEKEQDDLFISDHPRRLDWIGAMEESILAIERATLYEGENRRRDIALSKLYETYGRALMQLSSRECRALAHDPHTLLMGAAEITLSSSSAKSLDDPSSLTLLLCWQNAENSFRNAISLDSNNESAQDILQQGLLQRSSGGGDDNHNNNIIHARKPTEFVSQLFDSFADTFDDKLIRGLQYRVPQLVGAAVRSILEKKQQQQQQHSHGENKYFQNALDAGCGTGLAGRFLRTIVSHLLVGVDASSKMLDLAAQCTLHSGCGLDELNTTLKEQMSMEYHMMMMMRHDIANEPQEDRPLYDSLWNMDLESMTVHNTLHSVGNIILPNSNHHHHHHNDVADGFDLIVAADVLVYFGSLDSVLRVFANLSIPGAILVITCEKIEDDEAPLGWKLSSSSGRFAHTARHVQEAAFQAGYRRRILYQDIVPRLEKGEPVKAHLFGFELSTNDDDDDNLYSDNAADHVTGGSDDLLNGQDL